MSYVVELSQKLAALKTQIREILASHGITVSATDSIDYYMEKLKTLKIINQDKTIFYGGNYEAEEGYSGFGKLNIDVVDNVSLINELENYSSVETGITDSFILKYNSDDPTAEYIANPYSGPIQYRGTHSSNNTSITSLRNVRFNNLKRHIGKFILNYTGYNTIESMVFPDLISIVLPETPSGVAYGYNYAYINGSSSSNSINLKELSFPQLREMILIRSICWGLKELTTLNIQNLKYAGSLVHDCPKLKNINCESIEEICKISTYETSTYCSNAFINNAGIETLSLSNLKKFNKYNYYQTIVSNCESLTKLVLPKLEEVKVGNNTYGMINNCKNLKLVSLPKLKNLSCPVIDNVCGTSGSSSHPSTVTVFTIETLHFKDLETISSASNYFTYINSTSYQYPNLQNLILEGDRVVPLPGYAWFNSNATALPYFYNKTGNIYVPDDLVEDYKEATNWSVYANIIKPLSNYVDTDNIITRHHGNLNITIVQNNCTVYINGIEKTTLTNLPFYSNKDYNVIVIDNINNKVYTEVLNFSDIETKNVTIDLSQKTFKTLTINTNVQNPDIKLYYDGKLVSTNNVLNVSQNSEINYVIEKYTYKSLRGNVILDQNKTLNLNLEEANVYIELTPGTTNWGWQNTTVTNPKASDGWTMYTSVKPTSTTNYAVAKIHVRNKSSFTFYINSYAKTTYNYTMISNADAASYPTVYTAATVKANTYNKQYVPTTFNTTNWTTAEYTGLTTAEHIIYVVFRWSSTSTYGNNAGYLLFDPEQ